ncbi:MAG: bifunctional (p)ppGpp synthetase/guanosine-3',5'-bis(diphosphate) 3'-pyrophosphohydrolase [Hyphomonas sp.]|jgi:GTP diphosphokinase / guanosine-3',5'-bis(diphosphate) 3'-diphosphatase|nr:bifunctional (p)ppGpp synthetase/guanosine-3',5'-bis(diphosphate) 3'-pyrophosphohydrolase [Henriciella sp.]MBO6696660.1 bifunctional (p)ppGpp synthetase/guanosine-3',5'-bis(diphosphate) 3'-pyrophosphohydrolase [Henriciella sp.]MCR9223089.1 bifunctional (p)ppGpp synthetase/guanosine-3',5'-bis(diphosphate) 3'-pyrophosphohydrolase [Hyphomonas sp.]
MANATVKSVDRSRASRPPRGIRDDEPFLTKEELAGMVLAYQPDADRARLHKAYEFAREKHGEQLRQSGDPYYSHPVRVATLLASVRLDEATIMAGLLHDTVEDCDDVDLAQIEDLFGTDVAELVDGVTKLGQLEYQSEASKQAENFQKFILATVNDIRVLLVKLADRTHNMRTLHHKKKEESRRRVARETMDLYAPLARRVGLHYLASEMEDLAFQHLNPEARAQILHQLETLESRNKDDLERIRLAIRQVMEREGIECRIKGRRKEPYSIWRKLEKKSISFEGVADIFGFRVIVDTVENCYRSLGVFHTEWACLPDRFRDFISVPKPNGYASLHTTVRASGNRLVELQIRTEDMDDTAERGVAAHWTYKNSAYGFDMESSKAAGLDPTANLKAFGELLSHGGDANDFLEHAKMEMYRTHVFAFTPNGRLVLLPAGSMPLDFAYAVHTAVGDTCDGAKINGVPRNMRVALENGDVVEIIRRKDPRPLPGYETLCVTGRARAAQRKLRREFETQQFASLGRNLLERALRQHQIDPVSVDMRKISERAGFDGVQAMFEALGRTQEEVSRVIGVAFPGLDLDAANPDDTVTLDDEHAPSLIAGENLTPGVTLHLGECCHPIPGDRIIGVREPQKGLVVHTIYCGQVAKYDDRPDLWVDLQWTELAKSGVRAIGRISVNAADHKGVLAQQCTVVAQAGGNIRGVSTHNRDPGFMELVFDIEVEDLRHLEQIKAALRALAVVERVERLEESEFE